MAAITPTAQINIDQTCSGFRLLLLETAIRPGYEAPLQTASNLPQSLISPLHRQLISLCLHNPYWNDFRILAYFSKHDVEINMEQLQLLKQECGLDNRETICNTLLRLSLQGGLKLNSRQLGFIERTKPEFRDRDLKASQPGDLMVYECLLGRGIGRLGRIYAHVFVDIFTGYAFACLSQSRTVSTGVNFLLNQVFPLYYAHNYPIQTVLHSSRIAQELNDAEAIDTISQSGLEWLPTRRKFGSIEKFEKSPCLEQFLAVSGDDPESSSVLDPIFRQCLTRYNAANRLLARKDLLAN